MKRGAFAVAAAVGLSCGGDGGDGRKGDSSQASGIGSVDDGGDGGTAADDGDADADADADGGGNGDGDGDGDGDADGDGGGDDGDGTGSDVKFDLPNPDGGEQGCGGDGDDYEFSFIWIANSNEGTVSKIDTQTGVEVGRYWTAPDQGTGSPSRTSVNLLGDVAVSNRTPGSTTKIAAEEARCVDKNGNGTIETSQNSTPLAWDVDECILWNLPIPTTALQAGPRPTAWEGAKNPADPCAYDEPRLWIGYKDGANMGVFLRVDGQTGAILDTVMGPNWGTGYGPYGGAVNADGDLWATGLGASHAIHIDADTLVLTNVGPAPGGSFYGMAVAANGDLWASGGTTVNHYDVAAGTWTTLQLMGSSARGIQIDEEGTAWVALNSQCGVATVDTATNTITNQLIPLPNCLVPVGISIDRDQFIWIVDRNANQAFKLDPGTLSIELVVTGLVSPYTYSDMTGSGLNLVVNPPG